LSGVKADPSKDDKNAPSSELSNAANSNNLDDEEASINTSQLCTHQLQIVSIVVFQRYYY
jgi:hypothetical protein